MIKTGLVRSPVVNTIRNNNILFNSIDFTLCITYFIMRVFLNTSKSEYTIRDFHNETQQHKDIKIVCGHVAEAV